MDSPPHGVAHRNIVPLRGVTASARRSSALHRGRATRGRHAHCSPGFAQTPATESRKESLGSHSGLVGLPSGQIS